MFRILHFHRAYLKRSTLSVGMSVYHIYINSYTYVIDVIYAMDVIVNVSANLYQLTTHIFFISNFVLNRRCWVGPYRPSTCWPGIRLRMEQSLSYLDLKHFINLSTSTDNITRKENAVSCRC